MSGLRSKFLDEKDTVDFFAALTGLLLLSLLSARVSALASSDLPEVKFLIPPLLLSPPVDNLRPLIGILSQPGDGGATPKKTDRSRRKNEMMQEDAMVTSATSGKSPMVAGKSYIAASYAKWVEMAGARPVPLLFDESKEELTRKFNAINGLILPGGSAPLAHGQFIRAVKHLLSLAVDANRKGDYFPVHATCLGMEALAILISQNSSIVQKGFDARDDATPLHFMAENSMSLGMFSWMHPGLLEHLQTDGLTLENHQRGITVEHFLSSDRLTNFFNILTTSFDRKGREYVSTIAGKQVPFYGTQWHPEKNCFEWELRHIPHTAEAVLVCQAAANFFVNEARRNKHAPGNSQELLDLLIYNYNPVFSARNGYDNFEQTYIF